MQTDIWRKKPACLLFYALVHTCLSPTPLAAAPFHGSLYTPVRERQAIGPLPAPPIAYYPYQPREIHRLTDLPTDIRAKAITRVRARVGDQFFCSLRFAGGQAVDLRELHRVNPASHRFANEVPAYKLHFDFALPRAGIRHYTATISLRQDGSVLRELDLPAFIQDPAKLHLTPLAEVSADLGYQRLIDPATATATVTYDASGDRLVWHFEQPLPGKGPVVEIRILEADAHTGRIIRRS